MNSQMNSSKRPSIPIDAWEEVLSALATSPNPSPDREFWSLIAEQERLRVRKILEHRLTIIGVTNGS